MNNHISNLISGDLTDYQIEQMCKYHDDPLKYKKYENVREATKNFMKVIRDNCPQCVMRTKALQDVILARMEANAAIALDGIETEEKIA